MPYPLQACKLPLFMAQVRLSVHPHRDDYTTITSAVLVHNYYNRRGIRLLR
ncbi:MAG TPA: hypothetical protein VE056_02745 [Pyrinomonadaceae bacterium]|nr:hypothetical protein [Pyrinomonadaceae bacterium]